MQYETIILELMSRIKVLEDELTALKERVAALEQAPAETDEPATQRTTVYTKTTEHMMDVCYAYGKKAHEIPDASISDYADTVAAETGMNRSSALMYISAVKNLLEGKVFKRAVNNTALRKYFSAIYEESGAAGLAKAIQATRETIAYRTRYGIASDAMTALCEEFEALL